MYKIPARTLFTGKSLFSVPECHSTNSLAAEIAAQSSTSDGTVVITDRQTAGRGQQGNSWMSEPGKNLTFSVVLMPSFLHPKDQFYLNIVVSLAVHDLLTNSLREKVHIKWPNDVIVNDRKICGILIENQLMGYRINSTIAGVGLNVNQQEFPIATATSMSMVSKMGFQLPDVLDALLEKIEARYLQLKSGQFDSLRRHYLDNLYWRNEQHEFEANGSLFKGTIRDIDAAGKLMVEVDGQTKWYEVKGIKFVR